MAIKDPPEMPRSIRANVSGLVRVIVLTRARRFQPQGVEASDGDRAAYVRVLRKLVPAQDLVRFLQVDNGVVPSLPLQSVVAILDHDSGGTQ